MPEPHVVGFNRTGLRSFTQAAVFIILIGLGMFAYGLLYHPPYEKLKLFNLIGLIIGPILTVTGALLFVQISVRDRPALLFGEAGVAVGFVAGKALIIPWDEVVGIRRDVKVTNGHSIPMFVLEVRDEPATLAQMSPVAKLNAWLAVSFGSPLLTLGTTLFDQSFEEIEAAFEKARPLPREVREEALELAERLREKFQADRTHDGDLVTSDDFYRVFREGPVGNWDTSVGTTSPMDSGLVVQPDGKAWISSGAAIMFGNYEALQWRSVGDHRIEIRRDAEDAIWHPFRVTFVEEDERVKLYLDLAMDKIEDGEEEGEDLDGWVGILMMDRFPYVGPIRQR